MLKRLSKFAVLLAASGAVFPAVLPAQAADASWPQQVAASYKLYFNGFEVGGYRFESRFNGKSYDATSNANVSALFGAFKWKGDIKGEGAAEAARPRPVGYKLTFKTKSKKGSVELGFNAGAVASVALLPNKPPNPESVPLQPEHYKNVFDPMSAILAITRSVNKNPCDKRIPIFDGKARFDLEMSYKGEERIADKTPSGQPERLVVCRVKYVPIAGHKPKDFESPWVDYNSIEIALRPIPSANIFVPYRVTVPTTLGAAVMMAETVDITTAGHAQIALKQQAE
ncbi:MAG: DUF3108 domain-containing protein [Hyphomicrobium sp.]